MNKPQQFKIETPIGSIESDSGNHMMDVATVIFVIVIIFIGKKIINRWW
jgi:hypothetical protein